MSFLSKLKSRLFKSSSKIEDGLETIVGCEQISHEETDNQAFGEETKKRQEVVKSEPNNERDLEEIQSQKSTNKSFLSRIIAGQVIAEKKRLVDDELLESLEELLISADLGVNTAIKISASFAEVQYGKKLDKNEIKSALADEIKKILVPVAIPISISKQKPQVILVVGVNGSGKTTTIGKLASQFKEAQKKVKIVAADTFRAAAVEQLEIWGRRADAKIFKTSSGGDPGALVYDSMVKVQEDGTDILIIDTAGRLQNKSDLMEELSKIVRVLRKVDPDAPHTTLLVLDASTGQNAISQVDIFQKTANISGLVMTKLDGSAKGGILVAIADKFKLPIHAIGIGEGIDDLQPFDPDEFTIALTGLQQS